MNFIEQRGILKFSNKIIHDSGFYTAEIIVEGKSFQKTFFPANWSQEKVINAIYEAYNDFARRGYHYTLMPDGKYLLKGTIKEGIEIEMYVTKNGKIVTAYPRL